MNLIRRMSEASATLRQSLADLAAATAANSEATRRIHRAAQRIGRGHAAGASPACNCGDTEAERQGLDFIERMRRAGAAE